MLTNYVCKFSFCLAENTFRCQCTDQLVKILYDMKSYEIFKYSLWQNAGM